MVGGPAARYGDAVQAAYAAVRLEPLRESAQRAVVRVHLAEGHVSEAVRVHESFRAMLADEIGAVPSSRMRRLVHTFPCQGPVAAGGNHERGLTGRRRRRPEPLAATTGTIHGGAGREGRPRLLHTTRPASPGPDHRCRPCRGAPDSSAAEPVRSRTDRRPPRSRRGRRAGVRTQAVVALTPL
jgi:hypothetical protein